MDGHFGQQRYRGEPAERRILIDALVDSVNILRGRLTVHVAVAPPFLVTLHEVGLTWIVNPWCRRRDLNPHAPKGTSPSSWRVCLFRHSDANH